MPFNKYFTINNACIRSLIQALLFYTKKTHLQAIKWRKSEVNVREKSLKKLIFVYIFGIFLHYSGWNCFKNVAVFLIPFNNVH